MGIFRVEKVKDYTTISNYYLRDKNLSLKAKGLLTMILALPEDWNFTIRGLYAICKEGVESIGTALKELEKGGYLVRKRVRGADGRMNDTEYNFYEEPIRQTEEQPEESDDGQSGTEEPEMETSEAEQPHTEKPDAGNSVQSNTHISKRIHPIPINPIPIHLIFRPTKRMDMTGWETVWTCRHGTGFDRRSKSRFALKPTRERETAASSTKSSS